MTNAYGRTFLPFGPWVNDRNCRQPAGWSRGTNCQMPQLVPNRGCSPIRTLQLLVELFQVLVPERNALRHGACLEFTKPPYFTSSCPESWTWPGARMPDPARARERNCHPSLMTMAVAETTGAPYCDRGIALPNANLSASPWPQRELRRPSRRDGEVVPLPALRQTLERLDGRMNS